LLSCMNVLEATEFSNEAEMLGRGVILKAMEAPLRQILSNCGIDSKADSIVEEIKSGRSIGYNAKTMNHEDLFASGVIDPAKVVRVALENACSIAGVIITCECLDAEIHKRGPMV